MACSFSLYQKKMKTFFFDETKISHPVNTWIVNKVKQAFPEREKQTDKVIEHIKNTPFPVIVCGDFNDSPTSYSYRTIKGDLTDTYVESGSGFGRTYIGEFPSFRIDYIFADTTFISSSYKTNAVELSDHHPISVQLDWK